MAHGRAADDFDTIRARIEELRRERAKAGRDADGADRRNRSDRDTAQHLSGTGLWSGGPAGDDAPLTGNRLPSPGGDARLLISGRF